MIPNTLNEKLNVHVSRLKDGVKGYQVSVTSLSRTIYKVSSVVLLLNNRLYLY